MQMYIKHVDKIIKPTYPSIEKKLHYLDVNAMEDDDFVAKIRSINHANATSIV